MAIKKLKLRCNPEHVLDANGEGICATPFEGMDGRVYVGAAIDHVKSKAENRVVFLFSREAVVEVPVTAYYLRKLEDRELLPGDQETEDFVWPGRAEERRLAAKKTAEDAAAAEDATALADAAAPETTEEDAQPIAAEAPPATN